MKLNCPCLTLLLLSLAVPRIFAQGFVNLDFESANVSGYSSGSTDVPIGLALPGWNAYGSSSSGTNSLNQVGYNLLSTGSPGLSLIVTNAFGLLPLQGKYSALLFGSLGYTIAISQSGLVPSGAKSLLLDAHAFYSFEVTLGGQILSFVPLQTFSNYTLYGADISSFAGSTETLNLIAPPSGTPNGVEFDSITFSSSPVPEPGALTLAAFGALLTGLGFRQKISK